MAVSAETLLSHLEFVLDERVGPLSTEQLRFLDVAARQGRRLRRLVEDVRLLALAEAGSLDAEWATVDLRRLVRDAATDVSALGYARRKPVEFADTEFAAVPALVDEERLRRGVAAMLEHAIDRAEAGTVVVARVRADEIEISYVGPEGEDDGVRLALAEAIAALHGGALSIQTADDETTLVLGLAARSSALVAA